MTNLKYRPEIDGLRAIAVLAVIIYHAGFSLGGKLFLEGGFIGVDVFFVISGYLITLIILREIQSGGFTFFAFYERRARRILPVLFFVMLASAYFAWVYMTPDALLEYASSIIASLAFGSNFLFWLQDSYTAEPSALKPFLHTWSLSIEEQFYLFFPPILIVFTRYAKDKINLLILMLIVTSLVVAEFSSRAFPDAAFYLLPSRAWELLAGAFLAKMELDRGRLSNPSLGKLMPGLGLLLIILSIFIFDKETRHPSLITALPVVGTMLIIWFSSGKDWTGALLSSKPFVSIGLISYSLYLWHFPIFAFDKIINVEGADEHKIFNILMTFLLAVFSYISIEKPTRNRRFISGRSLIVASGVVLPFLLFISIYVLVKGGAVIGHDEKIQEFLDTAVRDSAVLNGKKCHDYADPCVIDPSGKKETIVLVGDSHAGAISGELLKYAVRNGYGYAQFTSSACTHIHGLYNPNRNKKFNEKCEQNSRSFEGFIKK